jgi:DNA-binding MarR family transcriptional regulator
VRGQISSTMTRAERVAQHEYNRRRYLPSQLDAARRKVRALENEAERYGMRELLENTVHLDRAWDRAVIEAQIETEAKGGSIGFGEALR